MEKRRWMISSSANENSIFVHNDLSENIAKKDIKRKLFITGLILIFTILLLINISFISAQKYSVNVTPEHPFLLANGNYVAAKDLKVGMQLMTDNGKKIKITSVKEVIPDEPVLVYNLEAGQYSNFILPGGVVVHNSNQPHGPYWMDPNKVYTSGERINYARGLLGDVADKRCYFIDSTGRARQMSLGDAILFANDNFQASETMEKFLFLTKLQDSYGNRILSNEQILSLSENNICNCIKAFGEVPPETVNPHQYFLDEMARSEAAKQRYLELREQFKQENTFNSHFVGTFFERVGKTFKNPNCPDYSNQPWILDYIYDCSTGRVTNPTSIYMSRGRRVLNGDYYVLILKDGTAFISSTISSISSLYPLYQKNSFLEVDAFFQVRFANGKTIKVVKDFCSNQKYPYNLEILNLRLKAIEDTSGCIYNRFD